MFRNKHYIMLSFQKYLMKYKLTGDEILFQIRLFILVSLNKD